MAKTAPINMRVEPEQQALLNRAAALTHKDRTAFIMEAACQKAEEVLLDERLFQLDEEQFLAFIAALDAPVKDVPALRELLAKPAPWE